MTENSPEHCLSSLFDRTLPTFIKQLNENEESDFISLAKKPWFISFLGNLESFIEVDERHWKDNDKFLSLLNKVHNEISSSLATEENNMIGETKAAGMAAKIAIVTGGVAIAAICVGMGYFYLKKQKESQQKTTGSFDNNKANVVNAAKPSVPSEVEEQSTYNQYNLLAIISANKLPPEFKNQQLVDKNKAEELITDVVRAYCFKDGDAKGKQILDAVECSDEQIDYTNESRIFVHLKLQAKPSITQQRDRLGIRECIAPNQPIKIELIKKLQKARSTSDFYDI